MIVSTDYSFLRIGTWQSEISRNEVFERFPDKRSWWIDSSGKIFDAGNDHQQFIKDHPELFDPDEIVITYQAVKKFWVRISMWGPSFTIQSRDINQKQLDAAQILYMREGGGKNVEFFQEGVIQTSFDKEEFLELKNTNQLKRTRTRVGSSQSSRAWFVSPRGEVIDCGQSHDQCQRDRPEVFGNIRDLGTLLEMGWIRVGDVGYSTYIHCDRMTAKQLDKVQELVVGISHETVEINKKDRITKMTRGEFLSLNSPGEINRRRAKSLSDRVNSKILLSSDYKSLRLAKSPSDYQKEQHPDKRSWWVDPQGKIYDVGHDHNKFLEENKKIFGAWADINKALTMNWIRVAFWGGEYVVHCHHITRPQIAACQQIYKSLGGDYKVYISTLNKSGYMSPGGPDGFIWADSSSDLIRNLFKDPTGIRGYRRSRQAATESRAWLLSPDGEVIDCGRDHANFVKENQDLFRSMGAGGKDIEKLVKEGWGRIGLLGPLLYINCERLNNFFFKTLQELTEKFQQVGRVLIDNKVIDRQEFLWMDDPIELKWIPVNTSRQRSASQYTGRAWLISPEGETYSCNDDHLSCVFEGPLDQLWSEEGFEESDYAERSAILEKWLNRNGWAKVGYFSSVRIAYLSVRKLDNRMFKAFKKILSEWDLDARATVAVEDPSRSTFYWEDFRWFDSVLDMRKFARGGVNGRRSASKYEKRAWLISPQGQIVNCGDDHEGFVLKNQDFFKEMGYEGKSLYTLIKDYGWARIGLMTGFLYVECNELTTKYFDILQSMAINMNPTKIQLILSRGTIEFSRYEFLEFNSPSGVNRHLLRASRKVSSLPKSRNFLMGVSLDSMPWPLRQAFDLLNLSEKKDKLSANQVVSVFQAHDEFLQDHLGRNATELIRDLNGFFQYGSKQEQIA